MTRMRIFNICNKIIEYTFYILFFLVPLTFASDTYELFEFNKMWLTYGLTIIIAGSWFTKIVLQRKIIIQRTPLDIPIALFLLSQIISTIFSWDMHVSVWGYYSRFNGGLLSIASYIFLYYAFISNLANLSIVKRSLLISLISGAIVALWGLPSHFGYDPTCLIFRGTLDVSCWTADFQPMVRIFSTLGQPDWLAAYLAILLPLSITMFLGNIKPQLTAEQKVQSSKFKVQSLGKPYLFAICYLLFAILFYIDLLYTGARSGVLAAWLSLVFFFFLYIWSQRKELTQSFPNKLFSKFWHLFTLLVLFLFITFFAGQPFSQLEKFTLDGIKTSLFKPSATSNQQSVKSPTPLAGELGGTDSSKIRLIVWQGAIDAWKSYPIFGTGVETFASAYYRFKPAQHNLTSEWNFLYNKAHNEYLNYLATTGLFGLGSYLLMVGTFIFLFFKRLNPKSEIRNPKQYQNTNDKNSKRFEHSNFENSNLFRVSIFEFRILNIALLAGYLSILVTNFFGFSVVITNIYLFLIPAFVFTLGGILQPKNQFIFPKTESVRQLTDITKISPYQWTFIFFIILASCFLLLNLTKFWIADKSYALGYNLNRAGEHNSAFPHLQKAIDLRGGEPVFKDELAINNAILAAAYLTQEDAKTSSDSAILANQLAQNAISLSDFITSKYPNNVVFWKSRVRVFYSLGQIDPKYLADALSAIKKASELAPTDANISYNLGVLYGQNGDIKKAIKVLNNTIKLKPDYRDAYYALGLFYHEEALDKDGKVIDSALPGTVQNPALQKKAIELMDFILTHIATDDTAAKEALKSWEKN